MSSRTDLLKQAEIYCARQERCTRDVEEKLRAWDARQDDIPAILESLRKGGFLNEERYAASFARGEFRTNKWGRMKIRYALAARGIPGEIIGRALETIDPDEYREQAEELIRRKLSEIKREKKLNIRSKIYNFAYGKGYESGLILDILKELKI